MWPELVTRFKRFLNSSADRSVDAYGIIGVAS
jgi:hypothetical protein